MSICATIGKPIISGIDACIHDGFVGFFEMKPEVIREFLYYFLQSKESELAGKGQPGTQKNLNTGIVESTPIALPPLEEQRKIAAILSSVDETIEKTQAVIDQVQVVKKGLMQELLTRGLPGRHKKFKQTEIGEIPEAWEVAELSSLVARPICYGVLKPGPHVPGGVPIVRVQNYPHDRLNLCDILCSSPQIVAPYARSRLEPNDLLISIRGTAGRVCIVPPSLAGANVSRDSARVSLRNRAIVSYIYFFLRSPVAQRFVLGEMRGLAVRGINIGDLKRLPCPLPPSDERQHIATILATAEDYVSGLRNERMQLARLKQGLMSMLLTGEVRVNVQAEAAE